jgi:minor histocompatibility antigen H13
VGQRGESERDKKKRGRERDKEKTLNLKLSTPLKTSTLLSQEPTDLSLTVPELASGAAASLFALWYAMKKHWLSNNALGLAFSITGVEHLSLGAVSTGVILLSGLFFYDIFWVFCTPVMVTVAKAFDAPIKLLFPRFGGGPVAARLAAAAGVAADGKGLSPFSMLGLGDIVIPGVFVALLLRFDCLPERQQRLRGAKAGAAAAARATTRASSAGAAEEKKKFLSSCPYPYFVASFFGYVLGLGTTIVVMNVFNAAQPALLYIVPAVLGATAVAGAARGELKAVFSFSEEPEEEEGEEKKEKKKDK